MIKRLKVCRSSYFVAPKGRVMPHSNLKPSAGARRRHRQQNVAVIYDKFSFLHVPAEMFLCVWDDRWKWCSRQKTLFLTVLHLLHSTAVKLHCTEVYFNKVLYKFTVMHYDPKNLYLWTQSLATSVHDFVFLPDPREAGLRLSFQLSYVCSIVLTICLRSKLTPTKQTRLKM